MRGLCLASLCLRFDFSLRWHLLSPDRTDKPANDDRKTLLALDKHKQRSKFGSTAPPRSHSHTYAHTHRCTTINYETKRYCHLAASRFDRATFNVPYIYIWPAVAALGRSQKQLQSTLPSQSLLQLQRRTCCRLSCCLVTR